MNNEKIESYLESKGLWYGSAMRNEYGNLIGVGDLIKEYLNQQTTEQSNRIEKLEGVLRLAYLKSDESEVWRVIEDASKILKFKL